ncbi:hypothetical protein [Aggregatilinea lenta]|uniref:hypothetical protein n=1 Tax=Aggregatilinea lenta TaxID=913108 RepID=UPI000E5C02AD|nr:hypothetical protein [Aggregatilinea lenta]
MAKCKQCGGQVVLDVTEHHASTVYFDKDGRQQTVETGTFITDEVELLRCDNCHAENDETGWVYTEYYDSCREDDEGGHRLTRVEEADGDL